ncbi:hypothetical protein [Massilia rubra]|uniref:Uncharacterized protein n=1 Tax=Massilia rubra TaxID=2607910 RepID=A0ABX0LN99_9BURK|nr:hypothetical protein [Massilia rubra]NHZ35855.1 hypothetical protein [Massilia rubra]
MDNDDSGAGRIRIAPGYATLQLAAALRANGAIKARQRWTQRAAPDHVHREALRAAGLYMPLALGDA